MKRSVQREAILSELRKLTSHPTAEELYLRLKDSMPHLSLATVYRNLEQFVQVGMVMKLDCGGALKRFDGNVEPHPHMRCHECGKVADVQNEKVEKLQNSLLELLPQLNCSGLSVEFCGVCAECGGDAVCK